MLVIDQQNKQMQDQVEMPENGDLYKSARNNFITKTYSIVACQLIITTIFVVLSMNIPALHQFQTQHTALNILAVLITIGVLISFAACPDLTQKYPTNMILLTVFTLAQSYSVSTICSFYDSTSVFLAAGVTAAATVGLTFYAFYSKEDLTSYWHGLNAIGWSFFLAVVFLSFANMLFSIPLISTFIALCFAVIYSAYLVIDTQLIIGRGKVKLSLDNYVLGAIFLYIDIIGLFLQILRLLGKTNND